MFGVGAQNGLQKSAHTLIRERDIVGNVDSWGKRLWNENGIVCEKGVSIRRITALAERSGSEKTNKNGWDAVHVS